MLRYFFYPIFGTAVLGGYALSAVTATDLSSVDVHRSAVPAEYRTTGYHAAPIVWRTAFHGPRALPPPTVPSSSGSGSYGGGRSYGGGGYYGGSSWGK